MQIMGFSVLYVGYGQNWNLGVNLESKSGSYHWYYVMNCFVNVECEFGAIGLVSACMNRETIC